MTLSVIIITKNESASIRRCIESVNWADEIVVVDSGSSDNTVEICRMLGAQVSSTFDWPGFGPQKNRALDLATRQWVLSLDADEWVTPELRDEIRSKLNHSVDVAAYRMPRLSSFCGTYLKHGGWWPDNVVRLFRRNQARFSDNLVHEQVIVSGVTATLQQHLMHESIRDLDQALAKMNAYSTAGAHMMLAKGRRSSLATAMIRGAWAFFRSYVLRAGFLDGSAGFIQAVAHGEGTYYRYLKLAHLQTSGKRTDA